MDLLTAAVTDNVRWCALASAGGTDRGGGVWTVDGRPPPLFPDAVTLAPGVEADRLAGLLADRPGCSVKDSFADVDLAPHGFETLFEARWIGRPPVAPDAGGWTHTTDLVPWCAAAGLPVVPPVDPSVRVLQLRRGATIVGGAVLHRSVDVVGLTNVSGGPPVWDTVAAAAAVHFPGVPVVGYEHGADLVAARAAGFDELGPLRIWLRP